jgi:hypothetical protein
MLDDALSAIRVKVAKSIKRVAKSMLRRVIAISSVICHAYVR